MKDPITLSEGSEQFKAIKEEWKKKAHGVTIDTLPEFLQELSEQYRHDYGTICHAMAAAAVAAVNALDKSEQGGITGFQAGAVMWEFIRLWNYSNNKTGLKLIDFDDMLYPQYGYKFIKTITPGVWASLQKEAAKNIADTDAKYAKYLVDLAQYETDIAAFVEKYPDYYDNRSHYDHLNIGTGEEWDAYNEKKRSGFEFAPREPYPPISSDSEVYQHWVSIVNGVVPFGYKVHAN